MRGGNGAGSQVWAADTLVLPLCHVGGINKKTTAGEKFKNIQRWVRPI